MDSGCIIIPVLDNFEWPNPDDLPEDIRSLQRFNGVHWNHDYQEASINKLAEYVLNYFIFHYLMLVLMQHSHFSFMKPKTPCRVM